MNVLKLIKYAAISDNLKKKENARKCSMKIVKYKFQNLLNFENISKH